eukprot:m.81844 g.81844  ORF g.81844 m.81844 type:complete len:141 (+) comp21011_c0_seq1:1169-1591(+)
MPHLSILYITILLSFLFSSTAITLINAAGGRAVVAHPPTLGSSWYDRFSPLVPELAKAGLWGLEAFSSEINLENHLKIHQLADDNHLAITGGSDNHGTLKTYAKLGDVHRDGTDTYEQLSLWAGDGLAKSNKVSAGHEDM